MDNKICSLVRSLSLANIPLLIEDNKGHKYQICVSRIHQSVTASVRCKCHIAGPHRTYGSIVIIVALARKNIVCLTFLMVLMVPQCLMVIWPSPPHILSTRSIFIINSSLSVFTKRL